jgi:hypothetical protein
MAAVVSYHTSYTVSSPPSTRMEYDHGTFVANPLVLMIFMILVSVLTLKLPKALARENDMERVGQLHLGILIVLILFWLFYALGGNAYLVWVLGIALAAGAYGTAHMVYVRGWRNMAIPLEGIDLGEAIAASEPVDGSTPLEAPPTKGPAILGRGATGVDPHPEEDVLVVMPTDDAETLTPADPAAMAPAYITPPPGQGPVAVEAPPGPVAVQAQPAPEDAPAPATKAMRCRCGGTFRVPLEPRPLEVQCPHCGVKGTLRT